MTTPKFRRLRRAEVWQCGVGPLVFLAPIILFSTTNKAEILVVDIIPPSLSGETGQDSEPNIAVDLGKVNNLAASAFTRAPLGEDKAPIFMSFDGGHTWNCRPYIPIHQITSDVTLRFGASGDLYVAAIDCPDKDCDDRLFIGRTDSFAKSGALLQMNETDRIKVDQPYITATALEKKDHVFIGENDGKAPNGKTATVDRSLDAAGPKPGADYTPLRVEDRDPCDKCGDDPEVRIAASSDGKIVYAVFNRVTKIDPPDQYKPQVRTGDVVIVRDDEGGNSTIPFSVLNDPDDGVAGFRVVKKRQFSFDYMLGQDRLGGDLAVAVDPRNARRVYLVWSDRGNNQLSVLHLWRSDNSGASWTEDLRTIPNAKNPGLAINANGTLGFLYQQVVSNGLLAQKMNARHRAKAKSARKRSGSNDVWMTSFERTNDDYATKPDSCTLAMFPVDELQADGQPFLGDYLHLMAVGNDFYGIFSSSNVPDGTRFGCDVHFQRYVDFNKHLLLDENKKPVAPSIDPFFFRVTGTDATTGGRQK